MSFSLYPLVGLFLCFVMGFFCIFCRSLVEIFDFCCCSKRKRTFVNKGIRSCNKRHTIKIDKLITKDVVFHALISLKGLEITPQVNNSDVSFTWERLENFKLNLK